ncbi:hypothetical protein NBRC116599_26140 [Aquicoccus sp. SU-CL01552]
MASHDDDAKADRQKQDRRKQAGSQGCGGFHGLGGHQGNSLLSFVEALGVAHPE